MRPLQQLLDLQRRYVVMSDEQHLVVALWIVHTHCVQHFEQTPYLTVTSPQRQCGKSRLLELAELLVPRPWPAITPSEAVVYRYVDARMPTLLLDEVDAIFAPKTADRHEGLRAILNAGHRRGAMVPRCIGTAITPQDFRVFCPKVLAGIGVLPDTITDRSIPIRLQRKTRAEPVERFRRRIAAAEAAPIREKLEAFALQHGESLGLARPDMPEELSDRMQEGCEPLLAIADALDTVPGSDGTLGVEARAALVALLTAERADERENAGLQLLADVRAVFMQQDVHLLSTEMLLFDLKLENDLWRTWYHDGLDPRGLAHLLRDYGIHSQTVRIDGATPKGYRRQDFAESWARYLPPVADVADVAEPVEAVLGSSDPSDGGVCAPLKSEQHPPQVDEVVPV